MLDWEHHREMLQRLYLTEDKPLGEVMKLMASTYNFHATKAQYETQFKKWTWRKNLTTTQWEYVYRRIEERKHNSQDSSVYLNDTLITQAKVNREMARHVSLTYQRIHTNFSVPPSPIGISVRTPPPLDQARSSVNCPVSLKRKASTELIPELSISERQRGFSVSSFASRQNSPGGLSRFRISVVANIEGLPYFRFQDVMRSPVVVRGFENIMVSREGLLGNVWSRPSSPFPGSLLSPDEPNSPFALGFDCGSYFQPTMPYSQVSSAGSQLYKPLANNLLFCNIHPSQDALDNITSAKQNLPQLLAKIPQRENGSFEASMDLLLGPPTIEAARYFVEIGVHLCSNHLLSRYGDEEEDLVGYMISIIPWLTLRPLLSSNLPTVQAFAEIFLKISTRRRETDIVKDLLRQPRLKTLIQGSGEFLRKAVQSGDPEIVRIYLISFANANLSQKDWNEVLLPLHDATTVEIARLLIDAGADVNALSKMRRYIRTSSVKTKFPVFIEVLERGDVQLAHYLLSHGADVNLAANIRDEETRLEHNLTPLIAAISSGNSALVKLVLDRGVNVDERSIFNPDYFSELRFHTTEIKSWRKMNALQASAGIDNVEIAEILLKAGAKVNEPACEEQSMTALYTATKKGNKEFVKLLLEYGADPNVPGNDDIEFPTTPLLAAVEANSPALVNILLDAGANVNAPAFGYYGSIALEAARALKIATKFAHRIIELRVAVQNGDLDRVRFLIELGVRIHMQSIGEENGLEKSIIHYALEAKSPEYIEILRLLVAKVEDINAQNENTAMKSLLNTAIEAAIANRSWQQGIEAVQMILEADLEINAQHAHFDDTPLSMAVKYDIFNQSCKMVQLLLQNGADVNSTAEWTEHYSTALQAFLYYYKDGGYFEVFDVLLSHGARLNAPVAKFYGLTELGHAAANGSIHLVQRLLALAANVNTPAISQRGHTALQAAAHSSTNQELIQILMDAGADVNAPPAKFHGKTALQAAVWTGSFSIVLLLLEAGADVNAPAAEIDGLTALGYAVLRGHFNIALLLLEAGADINASNSDNYTTFELAARVGRLDMVYMFLKAGADTHLPPVERYIQAEECARRNGRLAIVSLIEEWRKDHVTRMDEEDN